MNKNRTVSHATTYDPATDSFGKGHLSRLGVRDTLYVDSNSGLYSRIGPFFLKTADRDNQTPLYETNAKLIESRAAKLRAQEEATRSFGGYVAYSHAKAKKHKPVELNSIMNK